MVNEMNSFDFLEKEVASWDQGPEIQLRLSWCVIVFITLKVSCVQLALGSLK